MRKIKLIWDFRGPSASHTARHHHIHLQEFVAQEKIDIITSGVSPINDMHIIAYLVVTENQVPQLRDLLKPHRGQLYEEV